MDIAKIKDTIPSALSIEHIKQYAEPVTSIVQERFQDVDKKALTASLSIVALLYALIFLYVYMVSGSTIKDIESKLGFENVNIIYVEHLEAQQQQEAEALTAELVIEGLYKQENEGLLPVIRSTDNLTSFRAYQRPFSFKGVTKPVVTFVITDYGLSQKDSSYALDILPENVTFLLSSYSVLPSEWIKMAHDRGHEVWIDTPIQNKIVTDSGRNTIFHHTPLMEKQATLRKVMSRTQGYVGIGAYTDKGTKASKNHYSALAHELYKRGLGIFEMNPDAPDFIQNVALTKAAPYIKADLKVFKMRGKENSFETLEEVLKNQGHAIVVVPSYPNAIKHLAAWILKVAQADYTVVPLSAIYDLPLHKAQIRKENAAAAQTQTSVTTEPTQDSTLHENDHVEPQESAPNPQTGHDAHH